MGDLTRHNNAVSVCLALIGASAMVSRTRCRTASAHPGGVSLRTCRMKSKAASQYICDGNAYNCSSNAI
eukprot:5984939-Amphidinium_carterae.1